MYKIKQQPEDFVVEERIDYQLKDSGRFHVYKLKKKNLNTIQAVDSLAENLRIQRRFISYAGLKDRNAITTQYISIQSNKRLEDEYVFGDISLEFVGFRDERIFPGCLKENKFSIVVRHIDEKPELIKSMINYFGEQRFSKHNVEIGRFLVKGEFNKAVELILETNKDAQVEEYYEKNKNNPLAALTKIGDSLLRLYLHAYQSFIWNKCVELYVKSQKKEAVVMPLVGFGVEVDESLKQIVDDVLKEEGVTPHDFILRKLPGLGLEGSERKIFSDVKELEIGELEEDDLNQDMKKCAISFVLPKGSYATELIKQIMLPL